ncbi:MAG TPA: hypothetical protein VIJ54_00750 [Actinomycetes bacterium]
MNWYLLNIPLAIAVVTALVTPIFVVISREHRVEAPTDLSTVPLKPVQDDRPVRELELVS